jgi:hypothetical protein
MFKMGNISYQCCLLQTVRHGTAALKRLLPKEPNADAERLLPKEPNGGTESA